MSRKKHSNKFRARRSRPQSRDGWAGGFQPPLSHALAAGTLPTRRVNINSLGIAWVENARVPNVRRSRATLTQHRANTAVNRHSTCVLRPPVLVKMWAVSCSGHMYTVSAAGVQRGEANGGTSSAKFEGAPKEARVGRTQSSPGPHASWGTNGHGPTGWNENPRSHAAPATRIISLIADPAPPPRCDSISTERPHLQSIVLLCWGHHPRISTQ